MRELIPGVLAIVLACVIAGAEEPATSVEQVADKAVRGEGVDAVASLDLGKRNNLREAIRARMKTKDGRTDYALTTLINLGDTNAMREAVELRSKSEAYGVRLFGRILQEKCTQPEFLPYLARELLFDEPVDVRRMEDVPIERVSVDAARIMRQILLRCDAFPDAVRNWATSLDTRNRSLVREAMRKWWQTNQANVHRKEYDKTIVVSSAEGGPPR